MAKVYNIGGKGRGTLYIGTDVTFEWHVKDKNGVPVDISTFTMRFVVRNPLNAATAAIDVAATSAGTYNVNPSLNEQRAVAVVPRAEMDVETFAPAGTPLKGYFSLKRTDPGFHAVLAEGEFAPQLVSQT